MRVALKLAYDGRRFAGNQIQPGVRTVQADLLRALRKLGVEEPRLRWAGRTDAGVSAAGNVVAVDVPKADDELLLALTFLLEDVWAWAPVAEDFEPRHARQRHYRYHLRSELDAEDLRRALAPFVGTHDFGGFARLEPGVNPQRTVDDIQVRRVGGMLLVDIRGPNFVYNQVRRMVEAARRVAEGQVDIEEVRAALAGGPPRDFGVAPPEPLLLVDVAYDRIPWQVAQGALRGRVFQRLARRVQDEEESLALTRSLLGAGEGTVP